MDEGRSIGFARDFARLDEREIWASAQKWATLYRLLEDNKGKADTLVVDAPEALGDTYRELILNLSAIGDAGMRVLVKPSRERLETIVDAMVEFRTELGVRKADLVERKTAVSIHHEEEKKGSGLLRAGRKPAVVLISRGPDEAYCQAELLVAFDREMYKPTSQGREVRCSYEVTAGIPDEFLAGFSRDEQKAIELKRKEVLEKGWISFLVPEADGACRTVLLQKGQRSPDHIEQKKADDTFRSVEKDGDFDCMSCFRNLAADKAKAIGLTTVKKGDSAITVAYPLCDECSIIQPSVIGARTEKTLQKMGAEELKRALLTRQFSAAEITRPSLGKDLKGK